MDEGKDNPQGQVDQMNDELREGKDPHSLEKASRKGPWAMVERLFGLDKPKTPGTLTNKNVTQPEPTPLGAQTPAPVQAPTTKAA